MAISVMASRLRFFAEFILSEILRSLRSIRMTKRIAQNDSLGLYCKKANGGIKYRNKADKRQGA